MGIIHSRGRVFTAISWVHVGIEQSPVHDWPALTRLAERSQSELTASATPGRAPKDRESGARMLLRLPLLLLQAAL